MRVLQFHGYSSRMMAGLPMQDDGLHFLDGDIIDLGRGNLGVVWDGWVYAAAGQCSGFEAIPASMDHRLFQASCAAAVALREGRKVDAEIVDASGWMFSDEPEKLSPERLCV